MAASSSSVFGIKVHEIFLVIVCFQLGFFLYQFLYQKDDVRLHHQLHHEESKRDFFQKHPAFSKSIASSTKLTSKIPAIDVQIDDAQHKLDKYDENNDLLVATLSHKAGTDASSSLLIIQQPEEHQSVLMVNPSEEKERRDESSLQPENHSVGAQKEIEVLNTPLRQPEQTSASIVSEHDTPGDEPLRLASVHEQENSIEDEAEDGSGNNAGAEVVDPSNAAQNQNAPRAPQRLNREQKRVMRLQRRQRKAAALGLHDLSGPLYRENYFALSRKLYPGFSLVPELLPLKIMTKYVTDHSQQRLERFWLECGNTTENCPLLQSANFVVGTYSCPLEAGNRLHKFMNALIWAVTSRRFFLWRYFDEDACREEESELATGTCDSFLNTKEDCAEILQLEGWVPSWEEWSVKLNLTQAVRACGIGTRDHDALAFGMDEEVGKPRVLRVGQQLNMETAVVLGNPNNLYAHRLLVRKSSHSATLQFFKEGTYFTYGMLFESLFSLHPSLMPSEDTVDRLQHNQTDSYFIHSRHPPSRGDASEISLELNCMEQILLRRPHPHKPCEVVIMTDRDVTKPLLAQALQQQYNCTALSANTTQGSASFRTEHGSFAGRGYFEDLALVMQTRSGFLAPHLALRSGIGIRTSSGLPREIVEFRRVLESATWADIPPYAECVGAVRDDDPNDGDGQGDGNDITTVVSDGNEAVA